MSQTTDRQTDTRNIVRSTKNLHIIIQNAPPRCWRLRLHLNKGNTICYT